MALTVLGELHNLDPIRATATIVSESDGYERSETLGLVKFLVISLYTSVNTHSSLMIYQRVLFHTLRKDIS